MFTIILVIYVSSVFVLLHIPVVVFFVCCIIIILITHTHMDASLLHVHAHTYNIHNSNEILHIYC